LIAWCHLHQIRLVALVAEPVREVLDERAAPGHVEHVQPAADGQEGKVGFDRRPGHEQLEPVTPVVGHIGLLVGRFFVQGRIDIAAAA
jgi:hypothetical protein